MEHVDNKEVESKMRRLKIQVEDESVAINNLVDNLVNKYGKELERTIDKIRTALKSADRMSTDELERFVMEVPVHMFYALEGLEKLGVEGDNAKMLRKDVFNKSYIDTKGTIEDKTKKAELDSVPESYVEIAYQRAYRKLKEKISKAELVFSGCKKVLDKRTQEMFLNKNDRYNA